MEEVTELLKKKMSYDNIRKTLAKAGELINRENTITPAEHVFGRRLVENGIAVIPQFQVGDYSYDFKIEKYPILIEIDGEVHREWDKIEKDYIKWRYAIKRAFILVRFTNTESFSNYAVEETRRIISNCTKCPREIWLYEYTFLD